MAATRGGDVVPIAIDAQGGLGEEAIEFVKDLAASAGTTSSTWSPKQLMESYLTELP
jgi:hypothetical protein